MCYRLLISSVDAQACPKPSRFVWPVCGSSGITGLPFLLFWTIGRRLYGSVASRQDASVWRKKEQIFHGENRYGVGEPRGRGCRFRIAVGAGNLLEETGMSEVDLKEYDRVLNDYHSELLDAAFLSAHLLNLCLDHSDLPEWRKAACHMMCKRLVELAEALPSRIGRRCIYPRSCIVPKPSTFWRIPSSLRGFANP